MTAQHETLRGLIEPWLDAEQVELDDLELVGTGKGRTLRVLVDAEGGVDLDRIAELSLGISALLDSETDLDEPYQLEVSSPGLERKLRLPRHYVKSIGREVSIKIRRDGTTHVFKGVLTEADDDGFTVETDDGGQRGGYDEVTSAKTVYRWQAAPKPGKKQ
jgi:ribosome maturation factor RimP